MSKKTNKTSLALIKFYRETGITRKEIAVKMGISFSHFNVKVCKESFYPFEIDMMIDLGIELKK